MRCPRCRREGSYVIDTQHLDDRIRRRRICYACNFRWWTSETLWTGGKERDTHRN